jgi:hypothetical protein
MAYHIQHKQLVGTDADDEKFTVNIMAGRNEPPANIFYVHQASSTMDNDETVNITGKMLGCDTVVTANVHAQLTLTASEVIRVDLSSEAKGFWQLIITATELDTDQTLDVWIITW